MVIVRLVKQLNSSHRCRPRYLGNCRKIRFATCQAVNTCRVDSTFSWLVGDYAGSEHKRQSTFAYDGDKLNLSVFRSGALECPLAFRSLHSREVQGSNFSVSV